MSPKAGDPSFNKKQKYIVEIKEGNPKQPPQEVLIDASIKPVMPLKRNAIFLIVLSSLSPWWPLSFASIYLARSISLVVVAILAQVALIVISTIAMKFPSVKLVKMVAVVRPVVGCKRLVVFITCIVCSVYYVISLTVYGLTVGSLLNIVGYSFSGGSFKIYYVIGAGMMDLVMKVSTINISVPLAIKAFRLYK